MSVIDTVAKAIWDSLKGDTHTGLPFDRYTVQSSQGDRMRKMAKAAIKAMETPNDTDK